MKSIGDVLGQACDRLPMFCQEFPCRLLPREKKGGLGLQPVHNAGQALNVCRVAGKEVGQVAFAAIFVVRNQCYFLGSGSL